MRATSWCLLTGLSFLLIACGGSKSTRLDVQAHSRASKQYLGVFCNPSGGLAGIGFSPLGRYSSDPAYARSIEMACQLLAWSTHVRVKGERLFERTPGGEIEYRGENIKLLELPEIAPESCRLETLEVARHGWIIATQDGGTISSGGATTFAAKPPSWISHIPSSRDWQYAMGTAEISFKNEPRSWELATYRALVELAILVKSRTGALEKAAGETLAGASALEVDTVLKGFRVAGRWRDQKHVYVLGKVPTAGAVSYLTEGD